MFQKKNDPKSPDLLPLRVKITATQGFSDDAFRCLKQHHASRKEPAMPSLALGLARGERLIQRIASSLLQQNVRVIIKAVDVERALQVIDLKAGGCAPASRSR
jgi:hypothetical protein